MTSLIFDRRADKFKLAHGIIEKYHLLLSRPNIQLHTFLSQYNYFLTVFYIVCIKYTLDKYNFFTVFEKKCGMSKSSIIPGTSR